MTDNDKKYKNRTRFFQIWVLCLILFMFFSFSWFSSKINEDSSNAALETSRMYLKELNNQTAFYFNERIHDLEERAQMVCYNINSNNLNSEAALRKSLNKVLINNGFSYFSYLDRDGMLHGIKSVEPVSPNLKRLDEIMEGKKIITAYNEFNNGDNYLIIAVPIHDVPFGDTEIISGIFGYNPDVLSKELSMMRNEARTYSSLIHANGKYIINTPITGMEKDSDLLDMLRDKAEFLSGYSYESFIDDFYSGKSGMTVYKYKNTVFYTYYSAVQDYNLRIVTTIPYEAIGYTLDTFYDNTSFRSKLLMFVYLVLFLITLYSYGISSKNNEEILRKANNAKSEFLSRMSHEIRTPMNGIIGLGELARRSVGDDRQVLLYLDEQEKVSENLLDIINDVLDMSRIESGKIEIVKETFNLSETLHGIANSYGVAAVEKGINFDICTEGYISQFYIGDELRLTQILGNLCSNATKFTPSGGNIMLSIKKLDKEDEDWLEFSVKDSGCGISQENQARIFEAFEQENASTVNKFGGTGLGLTIVKNFTMLMGGSIELYSKPGEGSDFKVALPFKEVVCEEYKINTAFKRLLIVNESEKIRTNVCNTFKRLGIKGDAVSNAKDAEDMLRSGEYDICVSDIKSIEAGLPTDIVPVVLRAISTPYTAAMIKEKKLAGILSVAEYGCNLSKGLDLIYTDKKQGEDRLLKRENFRDMRILLAEDNVLNRMIANDLLSSTGASVENAENGEDALRMFEESEPGYYDIILMDIQMPVMNGLEATRRIRALDRDDAKSTAIYAMSANAFRDDVENSIESGMNGHLAKPVQIDIIMSVLADIYNKRHPQITD